MSALSGTLGAVLGADAQKDVANQNAQTVANTNAQNYQQWLQSRGSQGNAVLPMYMGDFEKQLGGDLSSFYKTTSKSHSFQDYQDAANAMKPAMAGANATAAGIFNGNVQRQMQQNFAPVGQARVAYTRQSAIESLNKTLGEIGAAQAGRGFTGDAFGDRMLRLGANKQMSTDIAGANLQNLQDMRGINDAALQLQLQNMNLPAQMASQNMNFMQMPEQAYAQQMNTAMQPLNFVRIGTAQPFQNEAYLQPYVPSAGQLAMQGVSQAGNTALKMWMQQQYANNLKGGGADFGGLDSISASGVSPGFFDTSMYSSGMDYGGGDYGAGSVW
jgi:hypothetical protein